MNEAIMKSAVDTARERLAQNGRNPANNNAGIRVGSDLHLCEMLLKEIERLEKLVYVAGQWRCAKCNFRLTQSNLYAASGTVGPRDEPGDKCPNCDSPLWRVSAMDDRNEAFKCANETFDRVEKLRAALTEICRIHDQNAPQGALRADFQHIARRALEADQPLTAGQRGEP